MIAATHPFQKRSLNALDENGNEGCASCGRPRDVHPAPVSASTPDSFDSPDGRTYSGPVTAGTPGQAAQPEPCEHHWVSQHKPGHRVYWVRLCGFCGDPDWDDLDREVAAAIAAQEPQPAPGCPDPSQHRDVYGHPLPQAEPKPAPGLEAAYLYHWRFDRGEEFGLYWHRADADAKAAEHAGEGLSEVLGMAILGDRPEAQPAPAGPLDADAYKKHVAQLLAPVQGEVDRLRAVLDRARQPAGPGPEPEPAPEPVMTPAVARPYFGSTLVLAVAEGASDESVASLAEALTAATEGDGVTVVTVQGVEALRTWEPKPAPELAAAMAETRELRAALRTLADLWGELGESEATIDSYREEVSRLAADLAREREQVRLARQDRDGTRKRMLDLAAGFEESAAVTAPSAKSRAEAAAAEKIRKGLDV